MIKKQNAFTLVELLGVITILGVLALIAIPSINNIIDQNKEKLYKTQIATIKDGLKRWSDSNSLFLPEDGEDSLVITLGLLKLSGFVTEDIKNPNTDLCFSNGMILEVTAKKNGYVYSVDEASGLEGISSDCTLPTETEFLYLKGSSTIKLNLNAVYKEPGFTALDVTGKNLNAFVTTVIKDKNNNIVSSIDTSEAGVGQYTITYTYKTITKTRIVNVVDDGDPIGTIYAFDYLGSVQNLILKRGTYKLEVWGAEGGGTGGGKGGYAVGNISVSPSLNLYIYVGGQGKVGLTGGGFNGGGNPTYYAFYGGGGATDIRLNSDSLYTRVIVAGGGGGFRSSGFTGGSGGGLSGIIGTPASDYCAATASSQIAGGVSVAGSGCKSSYGAYMTNGAFGPGGSFITSAGTLDGFAGGGGGWYGGGGGHVPSGGSGWIYTAASLSAWQTGNATDATNWLLNSTYYLANASTFDGALSMPTHDGTSTMIGNIGNGYVKITKVS